MQNVAAWCWAHAALLLMLWPVLTAVLSLVYQKLDTYSRWHAFFEACVSAGVDVPALLLALKKMLASREERIAMKRGFVQVRLMALVAAAGVALAACGIFSAADVPPTADALACIAKDAAKGWSVSTIAKDCGPSILVVIDTLLESKDARILDVRVQTSKAHSEADGFRDAMLRSHEEDMARARDAGRE